MADRRFRLAASAVADLNGISAYLGDRNPAAADRVFDVLYQTFELLGEFPDLGMLRNDLLAGLLVFSPPRPAHNYVVVYFKPGGGIEVNAVIHGARDWQRLIAGDDG
jgi:toxin ParE1/3/4